MGEILYFIGYLCYFLFQTYIVYKLMDVFLGKTYCKKKYVIIGYGFRFLLGSLQYYFFPSMWLNPVCEVVLIFMLTFFYEKNIRKRVIAVTLIFMCLCCAEIIMGVTYELLGIRMVSNGHNGELFGFIGLIIILSIIFKGITLFKNIDNKMVVPKNFQLISLIVIFLIFLLVTMIFMEMNMSKNIKIVSTISLLSIFLLIIYLYDFMKKYYMEKIQTELIRKEKQYYHKQIELLQENGKQLSNFRHDIHNHLLVIEKMLDTDKETAQNYMEKLIKKIETTKVFSSTGNIAVDSVINYKLSRAEEKGIIVNAEIILPPNLCENMEDIVSILGNILDNAIEANDVPNLEKYINMSIKYKAGVIFIKVVNSYDGKVNRHLVTKKKDKSLHGIGLKSVQSVVDAYNGTMDIRYDDKKFEIKIVLYSESI